MGERGNRATVNVGRLFRGGLAVSGASIWTSFLPEEEHAGVPSENGR